MVLLQKIIENQEKKRKKDESKNFKHLENIWENLIELKSFLVEIYNFFFFVKIIIKLS